MKTKNQNKTITQTKPTVDREAVRVLAIELGAREAARRLGIKESTVLSWAKRNHWKLPRRKGGGTGKNAISLAIKPGDALIAAHEELEDTTKTALMQTLSKAAQKVATKEALDVSNTAQLRDICLAAARMFGWDGDKAIVTVHADKAVIVCDEGRLNEIREQRQRLLAGAEKRVPCRTVEVVTAASQETQPKGNVSAGNDAVAQDQEPDPFYQHMQAIGKGESLRTGKGSEQFNQPPVVTDYMPWPEELPVIGTNSSSGMLFKTSLSLSLQRKA